MSGNKQAERSNVQARFVNKIPTSVVYTLMIIMSLAMIGIVLYAEYSPNSPTNKSMYYKDYDKKFGAGR